MRVWSWKPEKLELIREIVNINSSTALESLRKYMKGGFE